MKAPGEVHIGIWVISPPRIAACLVASGPVLDAHEGEAIAGEAGIELPFRDVPSVKDRWATAAAELRKCVCSQTYGGKRKQKEKTTTDHSTSERRIALVFGNAHLGLL